MVDYSLTGGGKVEKCELCWWHDENLSALYMRDRSLSAEGVLRPYLVCANCFKKFYLKESDGKTT